MPLPLPNCPTCDSPVHFAESTGGYVSYQCGNDQCDHFPATAFLEETQARAEWLQIVEANNKPTPAAQ